MYGPPRSSTLVSPLAYLSLAANASPHSPSMHGAGGVGPLPLRCCVCCLLPLLLQGSLFTIINGTGAMLLLLLLVWDSSYKQTESQVLPRKHGNQENTGTNTACERERERERELCIYSNHSTVEKNAPVERSRLLLLAARAPFPVLFRAPGPRAGRHGRAPPRLTAAGRHRRAAGCRTSRMVRRGRGRPTRSGGVPAHALETAARGSRSPSPPCGAGGRVGSVVAERGGGRGRRASGAEPGLEPGGGGGGVLVPGGRPGLLVSRAGPLLSPSQAQLACAACWNPAFGP